MTKKTPPSLMETLWKIYHRPERPALWTKAGDFHWTDPEFSQRVLREHLDDTHAAASRVSLERDSQIGWLWRQLNLQPGSHLLDITCGPGLYAIEFANRGCQVTGIDFSPIAIAYANDLAADKGVAGRCTFIEQDIRQMADDEAKFDAAILLYGQLAAFSREDTQQLLNKIARTLKPNGTLCIELLNQDLVDKTDSTWWFTDDTGLWADTPFLHLGERFWYDDQETSVERYYIIHLETGVLTEVLMVDQSYAIDTMVNMMRQAGFDQVEPFHNWDNLPLYDAEEWVAYVATKPSN